MPWCRVLVSYGDKSIERVMKDCVSEVVPCTGDGVRFQGLRQLEKVRRQNVDHYLDASSYIRIAVLMFMKLSDIVRDRRACETSSTFATAAIAARIHPEFSLVLTARVLSLMFSLMSPLFHSAYLLSPPIHLNINFAVRARRCRSCKMLYSLALHAI